MEKHEIFQNNQRILTSVSANSITIIGWAITFFGISFTALFQIVISNITPECKIFWIEWLSVISIVLAVFFAYAFWKDQWSATKAETELELKLKSYRLLGLGLFGWSFIIIVCLFVVINLVILINPPDEFWVHAI